MLSTLLSMITRGKVRGSQVKQRTVLQVDGLDDETFNGVELLLPFGMVARPTKGADILILQCNGTRDHKVALAGDMAGQVQEDLAEGEFGFTGFGATIIFRQGGLSVTSSIPVEVSSTQEVSLASTQQIALSAPVITSGEAGVASQKVCLEDFFLWAAAHTHAGTGAPLTPPPASGLSSNFGAT